jgi:sortase A
LNNKKPDDFSIQELRYLLLEKRRVARRNRLERFRCTGKVMALSPTLNDGIRMERAARGPNHPPRHGWLERGFLFVEILAILGLIGMSLNGMSILKTLNREVAESFQQPTPVPAPLIRAVVLPEGHTPPNGSNSAQPNEAEIPEHLRPLAQSFANLPTPIPASHQAVRIQIPTIDVDAPVVQGDGWEQLKKGVAQHIGTANPGEIGNIVLSGHIDIYGEVFRNLDRLQPGDAVILFTSQRQYTYVVTGTRIVEPTAVEVMDPTPNATLTLISCHPYLVDTHRIVVSAVLQNP